MAVDVEGLSFRVCPPVEMVGRFDDIQALRTEHYLRVFEEHGRSTSEVLHYVGRLSVENWVDPNASVGTSAKHGQERLDPLSTFAFSEDGRLLAMANFALNVSSKFEVIARRIHAPDSVSTKVGEIERQLKVKRDRYYVWGSEFVTSDDQEDLAPIVVHLGLSQYDGTKPGTFYPWTEEDALRADLEKWAYEWDGGKPTPLTGEGAFGEGQKGTEQKRYVVDKILRARNNIIQMPGLRQAITYANEHLIDTMY